MLGGFRSVWPYGYGYARRYISKQFSYFEQPFNPLSPPYNVPFQTLTNYPLPLDFDTVKQYLRIEPSNNADDNLILIFMDIATEFAESYTKRDFITKLYLTYRDDFSDGFFTLRKSQLQGVTQFEYMVNGVFIPVPNVWYTSNDFDYSSIFLLDGKAWPNNIDIRQQAIRIYFNAGYGPNASDVPDRIKVAMMAHIAQMYENRGDCSDCGGNMGAPAEQYLPLTSKLIYQEFRITDINTTPYA